MAHQDVQALDAGGHAAGGDAVNFGHGSDPGPGADLRAGRQVGLVGGAVVRRQGLVSPEPVVHLVHQARRLQPRHRRGDDRVREVEGGGEGCAVAQPRGGGRHQRVAADAAGRDFDDVAHRAPQLPAQDIEVAGRGPAGFRQRSGPDPGLPGVSALGFTAVGVSSTRFSSTGAAPSCPVWFVRRTILRRAPLLSLLPSAGWSPRGSPPRAARPGLGLILHRPRHWRIRQEDRCRRPSSPSRRA